MGQYQAPATTTRIVRHLPARETAFVELDQHGGAGDLLAWLDGPEGQGIERVYLVGAAPTFGWLGWALDRIPEPWRPGHHYLEGAHPVLRYGRPGRSVGFHHAGSWFPNGSYSAWEAAEAWRTLAACIAGAFDGATLLDTPATTGRELMLRSIAPGTEWPILSAEHQELIRATSGQARIETVVGDPEVVEGPGRDPGVSGFESRRSPHTIPALYEYDMRLAYAASAGTQLGAGTPTHDHYAEYMGQQRGRYLVDVIVPADWDRPFGLLGVKDEGGGWRYPHEPGEWFQTWCDGAELHVAFAHGWQSHSIIRERLLFPKYDGPGPLDLWRARLVRLYQTLGAQKIHRNARPMLDLVRQGVRSIILHSIGALHASSHEVTRFSRSIDDVPRDAKPRVRFEGEYCLWPETHEARWAALAHPEWSAAIWARTRARLLDSPGGLGYLRQGALNVVNGTEVVAFSTDAVYLTKQQMHWLDDGSTGRFRLKRWGEGPYPRPANRTDIIRARNALPNIEDDS